MLWYILTALAPIAYLVRYQFDSYRDLKERHAIKSAQHEAYKQHTWYKEDGPGEFNFQRKWKYRDSDSPSLAMFVSAFITAIVCFIIGALISCWGPLHREEQGTYPLAAVSDGSSINGQYFLFSGYSQQAQVYSYYEKFPDGGYTRGWQYSRGSTVYQDAPEGQASLVQYHLVPNKWIGFTYLNHLRNEFHVPQGTIKENIVLDNQN